jgi:hypothetical protein
MAIPEQIQEAAQRLSDNEGVSIDDAVEVVTRQAAVHEQVAVVASVGGMPAPDAVSVAEVYAFALDHGMDYFELIIRQTIAVRCADPSKPGHTVVWRSRRDYCDNAAWQGAIEDVPRAGLQRAVSVMLLHARETIRRVSSSDAVPPVGG